MVEKTYQLPYVWSMGDALFYSTGQTARELGTTQARVRALYQAKAIPAEVTEGGQLRIPAEVVEKLKRDGLPAIPRPLPCDNPRLTQAKARYGHPALLAEPSQEVVAGAEDVAITENLLKKRELERKLEETEDWFREREQEVADQQATVEEEERLRLAEEEAQRERVEWLQSWEQYALHSLPYDLPPEMRLEVHQAVRGRLERLDPIPLPDVTRKLVDSEVQKVVQVWERRKETERAVEEGRASLPYELRGYWKPTQWEVRAREEAATAIGRLPPDAPYEAKRAAAIQAAKGVVAQYEAQQAAKADAEMRQSVIHCTLLPDGLTDEVQDIAIRAIAEELAKLPPGTPRQKLEQLREKVLEPLRAAVVQQQQALAQQAAEERQKQEDRAVRESIVAWAPLLLPWELPVEQKQEARAAVATAIAALPASTPKEGMEQARDEALAPYLAAAAQRERKAKLVEDGLRGIFPYIRRLEQDWHFGTKTTQGLELEIREPIRRQLQKELTGQETPEAVEKRVQRLVREKLGIERRRVFAKRAS